MLPESKKREKNKDHQRFRRLESGFLLKVLEVQGRRGGVYD